MIRGLHGWGACLVRGVGSRRESGPPYSGVLQIYSNKKRAEDTFEAHTSAAQQGEVLLDHDKATCSEGTRGLWMLRIQEVRAFRLRTCHMLPSAPDKYEMRIPEALPSGSDPKTRALWMTSKGSGGLKRPEPVL